MAQPTVFVVDEDTTTRDSVQRLVDSVGLRVTTCDSADSFLRAFSPHVIGCVVMDVRMREMSGLDLHEALLAHHQTIPVIFLTAHADVPLAVRSMKAGAFDFFEKPYRPQALLERIQQAIAHHRAAHSRQSSMHNLLGRFDALTTRERQVVALVVDGLTSKEIAGRLVLSPKTIHAHRAEAMAKLRARSVADLTRLVVSARLLFDDSVCAVHDSTVRPNGRHGSPLTWEFGLPTRVAAGIVDLPRSMGRP